MKLILTAEVDHLGAAGDTVEVKDGYGRNYLLPRGLAIVATRGAQRQADDGDAVGLDRQHQAGIDRAAVEQDGACSALALLTAALGAGQMQVLAQKIAHRDVVGRKHLDVFAVKFEINYSFHSCVSLLPT